MRTSGRSHIPVLQRGRFRLRCGTRSNPLGTRAKARDRAVKVIGGARNIPLLAEEGWTRHQEKYREATLERSGRGGQTGETLHWRRTDHPVCAEQGGFAISSGPRSHPSSARRGMLLAPRITFRRLRGTRWLRDFLWTAQPPLLCEEGNVARTTNHLPPSARNKVASRFLMDRAATPPLRGGECCSHHESPSAVCAEQGGFAISYGPRSHPSSAR